MTALATPLEIRACPPANEVWERLWAAAPTAEKDELLLARERASKRWRLIVQRVRQAFGGFRGLRTLELGSGRGDLSALMAQEGASVTLLDASPRALSQASRRFDRLELHADFVQADLFTPGTTRRYDIAVSSGVIEHFRGRQRTVAIEAHQRATQSGGLTIISVPNAHCLPYRLWKSWLELRQCWPYGYEEPYSRRELQVRARQAGLTRLEIIGCGLHQSLATQLLPLFASRKAPTSFRDSLLDNRIGLSLLLFGWNA